MESTSKFHEKLLNEFPGWNGFLPSISAGWEESDFRIFVGSGGYIVPVQRKEATTAKQTRVTTARRCSVMDRVTPSSSLVVNHLKDDQLIESTSELLLKTKAKIQSEKEIGRFFLNIEKWNPSPAELELALGMLSQEAAQKCLRFKNTKDQKLAIISRLLQRYAVSHMLKVDDKDVNIARTKYNKPVIDFESSVLMSAMMKQGFDNFNINASHHGSIVAVGAEPCMAVGIDVVDITESKKYLSTTADVCNLFQSNLTGIELSYIKGNDMLEDPKSGLARFYLIWALKEAYVKANGLGLGIEFNTLSFYPLNQGDDSEWRVLVNNIKPTPIWTFHTQKVDDKHLVCVARAPPQHCDVSFRQWLPMPKLSPMQCDNEIKKQHPLFVEMTFESIIPPCWNDELMRIRGMECIEVDTQH
jgi:4'-phosphopantetheinyl transferase